MPNIGRPPEPHRDGKPLEPQAGDEANGEWTKGSLRWMDRRFTEKVAQSLQQDQDKPRQPRRR